MDVSVYASTDKSGEKQREKRERRTVRKLRLLKACGLFGADQSGAIYERATSCRALENAYRLVHDVYVETGYIKPRPSGLRLRHFECCPNTATFVANTPFRETIGVLSVIIDSADFGLPSDQMYKTELDELRAQGSVVCEFSNQAVLPEYRRKGPSTELMRCAFAYAYSMGITDIVCAVSPPAVSFYRMMEFRQIGDIRSYSICLNDPVALMHESDIQIRGETADLSDNEVYRFLNDFFYKDNPYYKMVPIWNVRYQRMLSEQFEMASLLGKCPEIFASECYRDGLERRLGGMYALSEAAALRSRDLYSSSARQGRFQRRVHVRPIQSNSRKSSAPNKVRLQRSLRRRPAIGSHDCIRDRTGKASVLQLSAPEKEAPS